MTVPRTVQIEYFAALREARGLSGEQIETRSATAAELYDELRSRYGFHLSRDALMVAVNGEYAEWDRVLTSGDAIVFVPPVSGG